MISESLKRIGNRIPSGSRLVVHAALKGLFDENISYNIQAQQLLNLIRETLNPNEIYVPTFTYKFTKTNYFDVRSTSSEVGRFSEEIRELFKDKKNRTLDPVFSVIETEKNLFQTKKINREAFGPSSIWKYLNDNEHYVVNINLKSPIVATQLHYIEYLCNVPYRYEKKFTGTLKDWFADENPIEYDYFVRDLELNPTWNRAKILETSRSHKSLLEDGPVKLFEWSKLSDILTKKIIKDPNFMIA